MNKWLELIAGLILVIVPVYLWGVNIWHMGDAAAVFLKGGIIWAVLLVGALLILLGINEIKE